MGNKDNRWTKSVFSYQKDTKQTALHQFTNHVFVQFLAFALFIAAIVIVITSSFDGRQRLLNDSIVGQVAPFTIEATRDFLFSERDVNASNRLRQDVSASVPSVYDWQEGLAETTREQIHQAFQSIRKAMAEKIKEELSQNAPEKLINHERRVTPSTSLDQLLIQSISADRRAQLANELRLTHFQPHLKSSIPNTDFDLFARHGFRQDLEHQLASLVTHAMSELIVANARRLERDREHGIYLRRLRFDKLLVEYHITEIGDRFIGIENAPRLIEEAARKELVATPSAALRQSLISTAIILTRPNTTFNESITLQKRKAARDAVAEQIISETFRKGQIIVEKGHLVTERHYRIIEQMLHEDDTFQQTQILAGSVIFALLLIVTLFLFGRNNIRLFRPNPKDIVFMATALLIFLVITRVGTAMSHTIAEQIDVLPTEALFYLMPMAAGGMLVRLVLNSEQAIIFTIVFGILAGIIADYSLFFAVYTAIGSIIGITSVRNVKHRMALMWSGLVVGLINIAMLLAFLLIQGEALQLASAFFILMGFLSGLVSGFFISAVLPVFETGFGYTTDIKLLELSNLNHPALRELILRAPGSYHHSMIVGSLSEAASESIGCNALLARVGATYHDIGKAKNPQYFAENQKAGENPHDRLKPNMSALIIKSHVKDGLDMARQHRLPTDIQDFIAQHHGTSLIRYFYHRAKNQEDPNIPEVDEKDYRYPGPKPQTRETAICMLADGVEAASRALPNPSPARLKGLVQNMINKAFTDGQLDECDLTLKDLNAIASAFTRILTGIYHQRPEYPGSPSNKAASENKDNAKRSHTDGSIRESTPPQRGKSTAPKDNKDTAAAVKTVASVTTESAAPAANKPQQDIRTNSNGNEHRHNPSGRSGDSPANRAHNQHDTQDDIPSLPRLGTTES